MNIQESLSSETPTQNMNSFSSRRFLTAKEAAVLIGKHSKWLERKRWEGGGPPFRHIGRSPIYEEQDLLKWIDSIPKVSHSSQTV